MTKQRNWTESSVTTWVHPTLRMNNLRLLQSRVRIARRSNLWFNIRRDNFYRLIQFLRTTAFPEGRYAVYIATVLTICTAVVFPIFKKRSGFAGCRLSGSQKRTFCTLTIVYWDTFEQFANEVLILKGVRELSAALAERTPAETYSWLLLSRFVTVWICAVEYTESWSHL